MVRLAPGPATLHRLLLKPCKHTHWSSAGQGGAAGAVVVQQHDRHCLNLSMSSPMATPSLTPEIRLNTT